MYWNTILDKIHYYVYKNTYKEKIGCRSSQAPYLFIYFVCVCMYFKLCIGN